MLWRALQADTSCALWETVFLVLPNRGVFIVCVVMASALLVPAPSVLSMKTVFPVSFFSRPRSIITPTPVCQLLIDFNLPDNGDSVFRILGSSCSKPIRNK